MLDFQNKSEIAVSDILSSVVSGLFESGTESKQKSGETRPGSIAYLLSDGYPIQILEMPN